MRGVRIALTGLILATGLSPLGVRAETDPAVYAHRGGAGLAPENTLGAFRQAHASFGAAGVWLETDTQLAKDGELVVVHDATLDRTTTNCTGRVVDKTSAELQACDARKDWPTWPSFEPVPTASQVLTEGKASGWRILMEIKNIPGEPNFDPEGKAVATKLVALVNDIGFPKSDLVVQSFFPTSLDAIKALDPMIETALLTSSRLTPVPGTGFYATENAVYSELRGYDIVAPDHTSPDLNGGTVGAIQALDLRVVVWTVDECDSIDTAIGWGVNGIISDRPDRVYARIGGLACPT